MDRQASGITYGREPVGRGGLPLTHPHTSRSTAGYEAIAEDFALNLDTISPETILNAEFGEGVSARRDHEGQIILNKDGQDFTWKSAVRAKLVSIG